MKYLKQRGLAMLDNHEITVGCLAIYVGFLLGLGLLAFSTILGIDGLARWGIAVLCLVCTYSIHRTIDARFELIRAAFDTGREYERLHSASPIR